MPHPGLATWTISITCVACSLLSTWSLALLATARIDRVSFVTERLHLGATWLQTNHVPLGIALTAAAYLGLRVMRSVNTIRRFAAERRRWAAIATHVDGGLYVLDDPRPIVFTVGGHHPIIIASQGLLHLLDNKERQAVLAHEQAHITYKHWLHRLLVELAIAAEPLLRPARGAIHLQTERTADEGAARTIGDRRPVLSALRRLRQARSAGASQLLGHPTLWLHFHEDNDVDLRINALAQSPAPPHLRSLGPYAAVIAAATFASIDATQQLFHLLDHAMH